MLENTRSPNPTKTTDYTPQKEDFVNGMGVQHRYQTLKVIERLGLYQSESGGYYIQHQIREIPQSSTGLALSSRDIDLGVRQVTEDYAKHFQEVNCNPVAFSEMMKAAFREARDTLPRNMWAKNPVSRPSHRQTSRKRNPSAAPTIWDPWGYGSLKWLPYPNWD